VKVKPIIDCSAAVLEAMATKKKVERGMSITADLQFVGHDGAPWAALGTDVKHDKCPRKAETNATRKTFVHDKIVG
jgi:hypothetical protein